MQIIIPTSVASLVAGIIKFPYRSLPSQSTTHLRLTCGCIGPISFKLLAFPKYRSFYIHIVHHWLRVTLLTGKYHPRARPNSNPGAAIPATIPSRGAQTLALYVISPVHSQTSSSGEKFPLSSRCLIETAAVGRVLFWVVTTRTRFTSRG